MKRWSWIYSMLIALVIVGYGYYDSDIQTKHDASSSAVATGKSSVAPSLKREALQPIDIHESLTVSPDSIDVKEGTNVSLQAMGHYQDGDKNVTNQVQWDVSDTAVASVQDGTSLKEGTVRVTASLHGVVAGITGTVYREINGHRLPPEPDPKVNDATLLGVDSNDNGVRDDVERWIYKHYQNKHPVHIDIAMQLARGYRKVLLMPERAKEIHDEVSAGVYCSWYYRNDAKYFGEPILVHEEIWSKITKVFFTTLARRNAYKTYDRALSGDSYSLPDIDKMKSLCDFNTSGYQER